MNMLNEFYNTVENNNFRTLPSQELINSDRRVAIAVWNNYNPNYRNDYDDYDYDYDYDNDWKFELKWGDILQGYSSDVEFWKSLKIRTEVFNNKFIQMFPKITNQLRSDKDWLCESLMLSKNNDFLIEIKNKFPSSYMVVAKEHFINNCNFISDEIFKEFLSEKEFIFEILKQNPSKYKILPMENKLNSEYILTTLTKIEGFSYLEDEVKDKYMNYWLSNHSPTRQNIKNLSPKLIKEYLIHSKDLSSIVYFVGINSSEYKGVFLRLMDESIIYQKIALKELIQHKPIEIITSIIDLKSKYFEDFAKVWIDNISIDSFRQEDKKMIELINKNKNIKEYLNESFEYKFSLIKQNNKKIKIEDLDLYFKKLVENNELSSKNIESKLDSAKRLLSIEIIKELKLPKNSLYPFFQSRQLNRNLPCNNENKVKNKI